MDQTSDCFNIEKFDMILKFLLTGIVTFPFKIAKNHAIIPLGFIPSFGGSLYSLGICIFPMVVMIVMMMEVMIAMAMFSCGCVLPGVSCCFCLTQLCLVCKLGI